MYIYIRRYMYTYIYVYHVGNALICLETNSTWLHQWPKSLNHQSCCWGLATAQAEVRLCDPGKKRRAENDR